MPQENIIAPGAKSALQEAIVSYILSQIIGACTWSFAPDSGPYRGEQFNTAVGGALMMLTAGTFAAKLSFVPVLKEILADTGISQENIKSIVDLCLVGTAYYLSPLDAMPTAMVVGTGVVLDAVSKKVVEEMKGRAPSLTWLKNSIFGGTPDKIAVVSIEPVVQAPR